MVSEMVRHDLVRLGELAQDDSRLSEVGRRIVEQAAANEVAERMGQKIEEPMVLREVAAGSTVPADLLSEPKLSFDPVSKVANTGWEKTWLNLGLWDRNWSESTSDRVLPVRVLDFARHWQLERVLSPEELEVVRRLNLDR